MQCFESALNLNPHFHMLMPDGVYVTGDNGKPAFVLEGDNIRIGRTPTDCRVLDQTTRGHDMKDKDKQKTVRIATLIALVILTVGRTSSE